MPVVGNWFLGGGENGDPVPVQNHWYHINAVQGDPAALQGLQPPNPLPDQIQVNPQWQAMPEFQQNGVQVDQNHWDVGLPLFNGNEEEMMAYAKTKRTLLDDAIRAVKGDRSASQLSDEYRALTAQLEGSLKSLHREQGELESAVEAISRQAEVVRDIGSQVRERISILHQVATQLEVMRQTLHPQGSTEPAQAPTASRSPLAEAARLAGAELKPIVPGLWQQDQG